MSYGKIAGLVTGSKQHMPKSLLTTQESKTAEQAVAFAKRNKKIIALKLTAPDVYPAEDNPVSVFMAGSPGAGKTEASVALLETIDTQGGGILRIDPDELRTHFPGYSGDNSWLFQSAVSLVVERIHDLALKQQQSFILDGTLASMGVAEKNIRRSLKRGRVVQILYVYQDPIQAWKFVLAREKAEGRRIRRDNFITQYFAARENVNTLKRIFGKEISVDLLVKNLDGTQQAYKANIDRIDNHIPENYANSELVTLLSDPNTTQS